MSTDPNEFIAMFVDDPDELGWEVPRMPRNQYGVAADDMRVWLLPGGNAIVIDENDCLPAIHFDAPLSTADFQRVPVDIRLELYHFVPEGHILRILVHIWDNLTEPYVFENFVNLADIKTRAAFSTVLTRAPWFKLILHSNMLDGRPIALSRRLLPWTTVHHQTVHTMLEITAHSHCQWPEITHRCMREIPIA